MLKRQFKTFLLFVGIFLFASVLFSKEQNQEFIYDAQGKRDPFIPLVTSEGFLVSLESEKEFDDIKLEGIIYDEKGISYAIINNSIVKKGDSFGDITILDIEKNKIIILKNEQILAIGLAEEE